VRRGGSAGGGGGGGGDLPALATQAQQFVATQLEGLANVSGKAELLQRLNDAQDAAHRLSNEIEDVEVPPELINLRAELGLAMRTITLDIGRIRARLMRATSQGQRSTRQPALAPGPRGRDCGDSERDLDVVEEARRQVP
jgi:hypothetical protein